MSDEYEKQAQNFLDKTKSKLEITFLKQGSMPWDDNQNTTRDIYACKLSRGSREYNFTFGQSIAQSGIILKTKPNKSNNLKNVIIPDDLRLAFDIATTPDEISKAGLNIRKWINFHKFNLAGLDIEIKKPSAYDILACLGNEISERFEEFCHDFGYNEDSIKAKGIYKRARAEFLALQTLYSDEELEMLQEVC